MLEVLVDDWDAAPEGGLTGETISQQYSASPPD